MNLSKRLLEIKLKYMKSEKEIPQEIITKFKDMAVCCIDKHGEDLRLNIKEGYLLGYQQCQSDIKNTAVKFAVWISNDWRNSDTGAKVLEYLKANNIESTNNNIFDYWQTNINK